MFVDKSDLNRKIMRLVICICSFLLFACSTGDISDLDPETVEENPKIVEDNPEAVEDYCPITYEKSEEEEPLQRRWKLVGILDEGEEELAYPPCVGFKEYQPGYHYPYMLHLEFFDKPYQNENPVCQEDCFGFTGFAGVNKIFGYYQFDEGEGQTFNIGAGMTFAGGHPDLLKYEKEYLNRLHRVNAYFIDGNELFFYYEGGELLYIPTDEVPTGVQ